MSTLTEDIIIATGLDQTADLQQQGYITHALCRAGSCSFCIGARRHVLAAGDCLIIPQQTLLLRDYVPSDDFCIEVIYVSAPFTEVASPPSNYGMRGHLALFEDPVMHLTAAQQEVCALNFDYIRRRLALPHHNFHRDAMLNAVQCMIIDFFDFHVELYGERHVTNQQALLMQHFMSMLDRGEFVRHRDVAHYADTLCVTPKHLSDICREVSGQSALYWITRYTSLDISRTLRNRALTLDDIADHYGFSSTNYLVRYVQKHLGAPPSALRE